MAVLTSGETDLNLEGRCDREQKSPQRPLQRVSPGQLTSQKGAPTGFLRERGEWGRPRGPSTVYSGDGAATGSGHVPLCAGQRDPALPATGLLPGI